MGSNNSDGSSHPVHVVMFPWFAFGHISPFVQLANKLSIRGVKVSIFSASGNVARISASIIPNSQIDIIPLQIPAVEGLPSGLESTAEMTPAQTELLKKANDSMGPQIESLLSALKPNFVIHDFTHQWLPSIASNLNIKSIFFSVFSAISGAYVMVPTRRVCQISPSVSDLQKPPAGLPVTSIASLKTYEARDFLYVFKRFEVGPSVYERVVACMENCSAVLLKTCDEMESPYLQYIETQYRKPVLLAGPVVPEPPLGELEEKWAKWLSCFPARSVIFCSFGSETFLKDEQIRELVLGLEMTGLPFLVVLNFPDAPNIKTRVDLALPVGFEERVKGRGLVCSGWVPQQHILAHASVGCFVCHSGFSSLMEGLVNDCQLVLLPQKGDQFLNSRLMSRDLKAGVEVSRRDEDGYFEKEDLFEAIQSVLVDVEKEPGKSLKTNHKKWREFLLNKKVQDSFVLSFVRKLKEMGS